MKRLVVLLCMVALSVFAFGCSAAPFGQDASASSNKPVLKIGMDIYEPYTYYDDNGQVTGIDYELAVEACNRLGYTPEFIGISWEKKNDLLASGEVDCLWSCYSMTGRESKYQWAGPYMKSYQVAVVRSNSGITALSQLEGKRVAVEVTTKSEEAWVRHAGDVVPQASNVLAFTTMDETTAALRLGSVDAVSGHVGPMSILAKNSGGLFTMLPEGFYNTEIGVAFDKDRGDSELVGKLNDALNDMISDGTVARVVESYGLDPQMVVGGE